MLGCVFLAFWAHGVPRCMLYNSAVSCYKHRVVVLQTARCSVTNTLSRYTGARSRCAGVAAGVEVGDSGCARVLAWLVSGGGGGGGEIQCVGAVLCHGSDSRARGLLWGVDCRPDSAPQRSFACRRGCRVCGVG